MIDNKGDYIFDQIKEQEELEQRKRAEKEDPIRQAAGQAER